VKLDGDNAVYIGLQGKGLQMTYWLHGKKGFDKPLPAFDKYVSCHSNEHHPSQNAL